MKLKQKESMFDIHEINGKREREAETEKDWRYSREKVETKNYKLDARDY